MSPDDPRHGKHAGYYAHRREGEGACEPCMEAKRKASREAKYRCDKGLSARVPVAKVRPLVLDLLKTATDVELTQAIGCGKSWVNAIVHQKHKTVWRQHVPRLMELHSSGWTPRKSLVRLDATGTTRRLQALYVLGWSAGRVAREIEFSPSGVLLIAKGGQRYVGADLEAKVRDLYRKVCMGLKPDETRQQKRSATQARNAAKKLGYLGPYAWNNIDDPNEVPSK